MDPAVPWLANHTFWLVVGSVVVIIVAVYLRKSMARETAARLPLSLEPQGNIFL